MAAHRPRDAQSHDHDHDHSHATAHAHSGDTCCAAPALSAPVASCATACCGDGVAQPLVQLNNPKVLSGGIQTPIRIMQLDCPTEEALLRKKLGDMAGVAGMEFNLMQLVLAGVAAIGSEAAQWVGLPTWVTAALALAAVLACGVTTYKKGWIAIRNGNLNINALMSIAVTGALLLGQWPEAAMVMVLFTIAELIEAKSLDRTRNAIKGLMQLAPERATVLQDNGAWREVAAKSVAVNVRVRIKPGERIALDGTIVSGFTRWRKRKGQEHRHSGSSINSPASIPRWCLPLRWRLPSCHRYSWAVTGSLGYTKPWFFW